MTHDSNDQSTPRYGTNPPAGEQPRYGTNPPAAEQPRYGTNAVSGTQPGYAAQHDTAYSSGQPGGYVDSQVGRQGAYGTPAYGTAGYDANSPYGAPGMVVRAPRRSPVVGVLAAIFVAVSIGLVVAMTFAMADFAAALAADMGLTVEQLARTDSQVITDFVNSHGISDAVTSKVGLAMGLMVAAGITWLAGLVLSIVGTAIGSVRWLSILALVAAFVGPVLALMLTPIQAFPTLG